MWEGTCAEQWLILGCFPQWLFYFNFESGSPLASLLWLASLVCGPPCSLPVSPILHSARNTDKCLWSLVIFILVLGM